MKFEIGQKVRVARKVDDCWMSSMDGCVGDVGYVVEVWDVGSHFRISTSRFWFHADSLELVTESEMDKAIARYREARAAWHAAVEAHEAANIALRDADHAAKRAREAHEDARYALADAAAKVPE